MPQRSRIYSQLSESLKFFKFHRYSAIAQAQENIYLPEYQGSTFRGAFGHSLKKMSCPNPSLTTQCQECLSREDCVYALVFESVDSDNHARPSPQPFVLEPPSDGRTNISKEDLMEFGIVIFGSAIRYFPHIIKALEAAGNLGVGRGRGRYKLVEVKDFSGQKVYDGSSRLFLNMASQPQLYFIDDLHGSEICISFITPTRLKYEGAYTSNPQFHIIIRALLRRISSIMNRYCQIEMKVDFKEIISRSQGVRLIYDKTRWYDWERYSNRNKQRMKLGGIIGNAIYCGEVEEFLPLLALGEHTHIGKNCTFGLGKYECFVPDKK